MTRILLAAAGGAFLGITGCVLWFAWYFKDMWK